MFYVNDRIPLYIRICTVLTFNFLFKYPCSTFVQRSSNIVRARARARKWRSYLVASPRGTAVKCNCGLGSRALEPFPEEVNTRNASLRLRAGACRECLGVFCASLREISRRRRASPAFIPLRHAREATTLARHRLMLLNLSIVRPPQSLIKRSLYYAIRVVVRRRESDR